MDTTTTATGKVKTALRMLAEAYKMKTRDNGETFYIVEIDPDDPLRKFIQRNSNEACDNFSQADHWYECLGDWLDQLNSEDFGDESDAHEIVADQEADVYTADLTAWLHASNDNVYMLTEVLNEYEPKDGFELLAMAQQRQRENWAHLFVDGLFAYCEDEEATE